jgi:hypothetical protein
MPQASFGFVGIGKESTPGTGVAPTSFIPVKDANFMMDPAYFQIREIIGKRSAYQSHAGVLGTNVQLSSTVYPQRYLVDILQGLFGDFVQSVPEVGSYKYTFAETALLPSFSFERSDTVDNTGLLHERYQGVKIESVGFTAAVGEEVTMNVRGQGLGAPTDPAAHPVTFTYPTMDPFTFVNAIVEVDGTPSNIVRSMDIEFTNVLQPQPALRGHLGATAARNPYRIYEGGLSCTMRASVIFDDASFYTAFKNATNMSVELLFEGGIIGATAQKYAASFLFEKVKVSGFDSPMRAGEIMEADLDFEVSYDRVLNRLGLFSVTGDQDGSTW